ncbi:uncharacterized protein LOC110616914 isoform X3 [Manihot esculenta]|uniref:uncharacterized protein LOC110616914 isoform X3 n=1 Tax=Manihot esculenta TaxID=3983 RepID=UPI001CC58366|nr:uncharacterized protein LOC110616914 isoform X3 [Manihot esculenta]XP_043813829.1 uncharacterized protein LOC110616914 isoform X3 [Manihot esculenta]XP_043813830.1 uncharacterized protein LOC110616914 isoform X3 [Manihot esculenta]XP_043813831.1 uncharacterized protein LOC110616914 isoform X3 [Manihot esculenta]XP_043813832.1 uncharacterized protein LOC110616914 isoform X3 [Manihot esculenta]
MGCLLSRKRVADFEEQGCGKFPLELLMRIWGIFWQVGGWQGSRVYGLGSAASSAFSQTGTGGTSTNVPSSQSPEWKKAIEAKFEEKYNSLQKLVEDQNQLIAKMRDELQTAKMGHQSSSLMPSSSDIPPAHRSLGDSHMD